MRLTHGATSTIAVVAIVVSAVCAMFCAYTLWLEPTRLRLKTEELNAQTEATQAMTQLTRQIGILAEQMDQDAQLNALRQQLEEYNARFKK